MMKVYLDTIGCRLNQSEIEIMAAQFRALGHTIVSSAEEADLVVVNTCAVTAKASADSRKMIRQAARKGGARIVVTGCWGTLEPKSALELAQVASVVSNQDKDSLVTSVLDLPLSEFTEKKSVRIPLPGIHFRTRSFIKVQDGCDNFCTFCITRLARGKSFSRSEEEILEDIRLALAGGTKEIVLTGVNLGSWGRETAEKKTLRDLMERILKETEVPRLRLSSIEPWDLTASFFSLWQDSRLCRHLHIPLQSGSNAVLKRMGRKNTREGFLEMVHESRKTAPDMALTTDMIVGFPGETEQDFEESLDLIREVGFAGGHVFNYSQRPGTPAEKFEEQIPVDVRKERSKKMRLLFQKQTRDYNLRFVNQELSVLWESSSPLEDGSYELKGLSDNYLSLFASSDKDLWNQISRVKGEKIIPKGLLGTILD